MHEFVDDYNLDSFIKITPKGHTFNMYVAPRYIYHYVNNDYEYFTTRIVKNLSKGVDWFLDIGACYGFYSLVAAQSNQALKIISVEPIEENYRILKRNLSFFKNREIFTRQIAVSNFNGKCDFYKNEASDSSSFYPHPNAPHKEVLRLDCLTVDEIIKNYNINSILVKIDVEGNELQTLKGMVDSLQKIKNVKLVVEVFPKMQKIVEKTDNELLNYIKEIGFTMYGIDDYSRKLCPFDDNEIMNDFVRNKEYFNVLCIRKEEDIRVCFFPHLNDLSGANRCLVELMEDLSQSNVTCFVSLPGNGVLGNELAELGISAEIFNNYGWWCSDHVAEDKDIYYFRKTIENLPETLCKWVRRINPNIIFTNTITIPWGAIASEYLNIPHVWWLLEYGVRDHGLKFYFDFGKSIEAMFNTSSWVFSVSDDVANEVLKNVEPTSRWSKTSSIYINVKVPTKYLNKKNDYYKDGKVLNIGNFGTLTDGKGQKDLVLAVLYLLGKGYKIKVHFAGYKNQDYFKYLSDIIESSGFADKFEFAGLIQNPYEYMLKMDLMVSNSKNEAFGRTIVEALLLGIPIVYANSGGPKEFFLDKVHGLAYEQGNHINLASKIEEVIFDYDKALERTIHGKKYVQDRFNRFTHSNVVKQKFVDICKNSNNTGKLLKRNRYCLLLFYR